MNHRNAVVQSLVEWADAQNAVRAAVLVGSRATSSARPDSLSDYDVVLFVRDASAYEESDGWLRTFGSILVMLPAQYQLLGRTVPTRLVQYEDGVRIDFSLCDLDFLERMVEGSLLPEMLDAGYRVLVDKDDQLSRLPPPSGTAYVPRGPTEAEYERVVNEFWWEALYVAKNLARGELLPAKYSGECVLRFECLVRMLEWYVQGAHGWKETLGPRGRGVIHLLGDDDRRLLERTYAGAEPVENWDALFAMSELFVRLARSVGDDLGFRDLGALGQKVTEFLQEIRVRASDNRTITEADSRPVV